MSTLWTYERRSRPCVLLKRRTRPEEVADALEDALEDVPRDTSESRPAPDIPATPEPDERDDPPDIPAIPPAAEVEEPEQPAVSEPEPAEPDTPAMPTPERDVVEAASRAEPEDEPGPAPEPEKAEAAAPGVAAATPQPETEPDRVEVPVDELDAIAAEFNFGSFLSLPDNLQSVVTELYRARSGLSKETTITPDLPEPEEPAVDVPDEARLQDMAVRDAEGEAGPTEAETIESPAARGKEEPSEQLTGADVIARIREERKERERAETEARPEQTAAEMIEAAGEGPVPLTGSGSIMEKLAGEAEAKQSTEQPKRQSPSFDVDAAADLVMGKLKEDTAFQNALLNTDEQNIRAEYKNALSRVSLQLLDEGHVDFYRWLVDNPEREAGWTSRWKQGRRSSRRGQLSRRRSTISLRSGVKSATWAGPSRPASPGSSYRLCGTT